VREILLPTLKAGDILVMDNLSAHKDSQALDLLKSAGVTVRFLPAYSPDLNPIELMWSKVKALLRKAEARTNEALLACHRRRALTGHPKRRRPLVCPLRL
jgi:transposase